MKHSDRKMGSLHTPRDGLKVEVKKGLGDPHVLLLNCDEHHKKQLFAKFKNFC